MQGFRGILLAAAAVISAVPVFPSAAADSFLQRVQKPSTYTYDLGVRYWYGRGETAKDLFDIPGGTMLSRLTYADFSTHTGELFGRLDHSSSVFLKGYLGAGAITSGNLKDEDFFQGLAPDSNTTSEMREGRLSYLSLDGGFNLVKGGDFRIGAFAGYHYLGEQVDAYGCAQLAGNPFICAAPIPTSVAVITQNNNWHSLRLGMDAELQLSDRLKLNLDAAWLPYVSLNGSDSHWLRIGTTPGDFTGAIPEDGRGQGYQLQAALSYRLTDDVNIGIGGRYWRMQTDGNTHFEGHVVGFTASPQPVQWKTEHFGVFVQASFKFGPYLSGGR